MALPHIFIINLVRSADRRAWMDAQLAKLGIEDYTFCPAIEGAELSLDTCDGYDGKTRRLFFGRDLTKSEVGCLLSHRSVYERIVDAGFDHSIVLEDDCVLADDFEQIIAALLKLPVEWDIIRFIHRDKVEKQCLPIARFFKEYKLARITGYPGGAYAYLLSQGGAKKLLSKMKKNWVPVDTLHGQVVRTGLQSFGVVPSPVSHYEGPEARSLVGHQRFDKTPQLQGGEKYVYPVTRFLYKVSEIILKRAPLPFWYLSKKRIADQINAAATKGE